jgi:hypothetical protein
VGKRRKKEQVLLGEGDPGVNFECDKSSDSHDCIMQMYESKFHVLEVLHMRNSSFRGKTSGSLFSSFVSDFQC